MLRAIVAVTDVEIRKSLSHVLEAQGFEVTVVLNRIAALVGLVVKRPDILVLNADVAGTEYVEFLRLACACHPGACLLLLAGERKWEEMNAVKHWLSTPFDLGAALQAILRCLGDATATLEHLRSPYAFPRKVPATAC